MKRPDDAKYDPLLKRVGRAIAAARRGADFTQEEFAERLGVIPRVVQKIESGGMNLTLRTIARIADALDTEPGVLVGGTSAGKGKVPPGGRSGKRPSRRK